VGIGVKVGGGSLAATVSLACGVRRAQALAKTSAQSAKRWYTRIAFMQATAAMIPDSLPWST
jgi:hypothetical protein